MIKYTLTVTEDQARIIHDALDLYTRIGIGQFENVLEVYDRGCRLKPEQRHAIRESLLCAKTAAGHPRNGSWGIHHVKVADRFRSAYDIQQVVRHQIAWDHNPKGGIQVQFDRPQQTSDSPLPTITKHQP